MLGVLLRFIEELRMVGIPVSMVEALDAVQALDHTDLGDRAAFKATLGATLVKNARHYDAFDIAFEVFFALHPSVGSVEIPGAIEDPTAPAADGLTVEDLAGMLFRALRDRDDALLRAVARQAVTRLAGMEPGRPVGGTYYLYRTLRQLDVDALLERLIAEASREGGRLEERLLRDEFEERLAVFRAELRAEIRRRLVADRGPQAVARTLRRPLVEDTDLMHATRDDLMQIERAVHPLTRKLASRLAQRRRRGRRGRLDFRRTVRRSLSSGGVPLEALFRARRPGRPEIVLLSDISGSVATFARFTMQFVYAMSSQFARVRSFAFVDALDEVTEFFGAGVDFAEALQRVAAEAAVVQADGHSDYGNALSMFDERFGDVLTTRSTVIITGDARSNYRDPQPDVLARIRAGCRRLYWLNPEPRPYWNTGDSVMDAYAPHCDGVFEVRNLRQLERFVARVADAGPAAQLQSSSNDRTPILR